MLSNSYIIDFEKHQLCVLWPLNMTPWGWEKCHSTPPKKTTSVQQLIKYTFLVISTFQKRNIHSVSGPSLKVFAVGDVLQLNVQETGFLTQLISRSAIYVDINGVHWVCCKETPAEWNSWRVAPALPARPLPSSPVEFLPSFCPRPGWATKKNSTVQPPCNTTSKHKKNIYGEIERPFALKDSENISTLHRANCFQGCKRQFEIVTIFPEHSSILPCKHWYRWDFCIF